MTMFASSQRRRALLVVVITALKLSLNLELMLQAVDRLRSADAVYLAVAHSRRGRDQDSRAHRLCRLLGLGLLIVDSRAKTVVVAAEPTHLQAASGPENAQAPADRT